MRQVRIFLQLRPLERRLVLDALALVVVTRLALTTLPFQRAQRIAEGWARRPGRAAWRPTAGQIAFAVTAVARYVPAATCLTRALATRALLAHYGYAGDLRIGVAKSDSGTLEAHAWIEYDGRILVGGPAAHVARYTPLPVPQRW